MKTTLTILLIICVLGIGYYFLKGDTVEDSLKMTSDASLDNQYSDDATVDGSGQSIAIGQVDGQITNNTQDNKKVMIAILHTNKGDITIELNANTPKTTENFVKLAKSGFYDGTKFHRVIKGFMNQGGDPLSKDDSKKDFWGTGGPGYKFEDEITASNKNDVGTISMANAGPNTNGSQFFINVAPNNFLDTKHTVFGKVTSGMNVVTSINTVSVDDNDRPLKPVVLEKITLK